MADATTWFEVTWFDGGREPQCPPDPRFPNGVDIDGAGGRHPACRVALPYPARRCGQYLIRCSLCGLTAAITTAGRPDDPRSVTVPCLSAEATLDRAREEGQ